VPQTGEGIAVEEYNCITVLSAQGESQGDFAARLSRLWTHMLRQRKDDFEKVYAETTEYEDAGGRWARQYLVACPVVDVVEGELRAAGVDYEPIERDELFSKYEATPPEWMQIEH
jgi:hypothetical protein